MSKLTVGSCFSGIGGLELGLEWTGGFETKWQIENDAYASAVLEKHWPSVKRYGDITATGGGELERVDVICGGFPCQDVSLAGKRAGLSGKRSTLWGEMFRLICEVKPRWVVAENVPGLLSSDDGRFFGNILRDLASIGNDAEWDCYRACECGLPQSRERVFIISYHKCGGLQGEKRSHDREKIKSWIQQFKGLHGEALAMAVPTGKSGGISDGLPNRSHRLKCLGNAVVPQVAQKIGEMILKAEAQTPPTIGG